MDSEHETISQTYIVLDLFMFKRLQLFITIDTYFGKSVKISIDCMFFK